jgi:hypothetical protein
MYVCMYVCMYHPATHPHPHTRARTHSQTQYIYIYIYIYIYMPHLTTPPRGISLRKSEIPRRITHYHADVPRNSEILKLCLGKGPHNFIFYKYTCLRKGPHKIVFGLANLVTAAHGLPATVSEKAPREVARVLQKKKLLSLLSLLSKTRTAKTICY